MEELIQKSQQIMTDDWLKLFVLAALPALGGILIWLKRAFDFHDKYFVRRRLEIIAELRSLVKSDEPIGGLLNKLLNDEAFRVLTGISTAPRKMEALSTLYCSGFWTAGDIRSVYRYLVIDDHTLRPCIKFSMSDIVGAWGELVFVLVMLAVGSISSYMLIAAGSGADVFAGFIVFLVYFFAALVMSTGFRRYRMALAVNAFIMGNPHLFPDFDCKCVPEEPSE
ncbi:MAG: hypothetical protein ACKVLM_00985 [Pseudomonadales bacterium]